MFIKLSCVVIALVSALSLGTGLTLGISGYVLLDFPRWFKPILDLWFASSAAADIAITIFMMALLLHAKANSCFGETRDLISRLIRLIVQTGLLTSILALLVIPLNFRHFVGLYTLPWYVLGKSQVISLLANLNSRRRSRVPLVHGSGMQQLIPGNKLSTAVFSPPKSPISEGGDSSTSTTSSPVRTVVQTFSQDGSITKEDFTEKSKLGEV